MSWLFSLGGQSNGASPSNEYSRLMSFRINCFDLLAVKGPFKTLLQHCNSKAIFIDTATITLIAALNPYLLVRSLVFKICIKIIGVTENLYLLGIVYLWTCLGQGTVFVVIFVVLLF